MSRSRPASNPLSFHKPTGQYYVTRARKRVYLGADRDEAMERYHRLALGQQVTEKSKPAAPLTVKELANRFIAVQQANWRNPKVTLSNYRNWLGRFLRDHPRLRAGELTVEMFAAWKMSLRRRKYSPESMNNFLGAVRAMYLFGEDTDLIGNAPKLRRVKNESCLSNRSKQKPIYTPKEVSKLLLNAGSQLKLMILLGLNCGFGPKDIQDLEWTHIQEDRIHLPRSKTGVDQTFLLWPETQAVLEQVRRDRQELIHRLARRGRERSDGGHVFATRFWKKWSKDSIAQQFTRLCKELKIESRGFYRLRHSASTTISSVASPHVQRKFMRHSQLQQQVTYTHTPDAEVDEAVMRAREKLLNGASVTADQENDLEQTGVA